MLIEKFYLYFSHYFAFREILRLFMSKELINFDTFNNDFGTVLAENEMFQESTKHGKKCIAELKDRLIEHVSCTSYLLFKCKFNHFLLTFFRIYALLPCTIHVCT